MRLDGLLQQLEGPVRVPPVEAGLDLGDGIGSGRLGGMQLRFSQGAVDLGAPLDGPVATDPGLFHQGVQGLHGLGVLAAFHQLHGLRERVGERRGLAGRGGGGLGSVF